MRGVLVGALLALLLITPFACASAYEAWTEGLCDLELDNDVLALLSLQAVVDAAELRAEHCIDVVVASLTPDDDTVPDLADPSTRPARGPPTA